MTKERIINIYRDNFQRIILLNKLFGRKINNSFKLIKGNKEKLLLIEYFE